MCSPSAWPQLLDFFGTPLVIEPSPGQLSSDAGLLPVRQFDQRIGLTREFADSLDDPRDPGLTEHTFLEMVRSRVYGILAGYADPNDHDTLGADPVFKLLADRSPEDDELASQPTLSRFENAISIKSLKRLRDVFLDQFIASFESPPRRVRRACSRASGIRRGRGLSRAGWWPRPRPTTGAPTAASWGPTGLGPWCCRDRPTMSTPAAGRVRFTRQTTPQTTSCTEPGRPVTLEVKALLELVRWCQRQRTRPQGGLPCLDHANDGLPPAPGGAPRPTEPLDPAAPGQPAGTLCRPGADDRPSPPPAATEGGDA